jgi:hypothetical protein
MGVGPLIFLVLVVFDEAEDVHRKTRLFSG